jgi:hypothetical protein
MRNKAAVLAIAVLITLVAVTPVLAGGGGGGDTDLTFKLYGTILDLDPDAGTITVEVVSPVKLTKYNPLTVQTTGATRFKECDPDNPPSLRIGFEDLVVGRSVRITGAMDGFVATQVVQYIP